MNNMFNSCNLLTNLNISNFKINENTQIDGIFNLCKSMNRNSIILDNNDD